RGLKKVFRSEANAAALFIKLFSKTETVHVESALRSLKLDTSSAVEAEELCTPPFSEVIVSKDAATGDHSFVAQAQGINRIIIVDHAVVDIGTTVDRKLTRAHVEENARPIRVVNPDILVCRLQDTDTLRSDARRVG